MVDDTNLEVQEAPKKKKKRHIGLWVTLIVIFVIVILPIGLVFAFFFDPSHKTSEELGIQTTGEHRGFADNLEVDLFDYTSDASMKNSLSITINEKDINQTLYDGILSVMDENTRSVVPQAYLDIGEDEYTFVVELNAYGFFKTRVMLVTGLELTDNPKGLMFELKNLKIARAGGVQNIILSVLKNSMNDKQLENELNANMPITLESHIFESVNGRRYLFYSHENFVKDMNKMIDLGDSGKFFKDFIIDTISDRKFTFDFYKNDGIHGLMPLQEFHDNSTYGSYNDYVIDFDAKTELNRYLPTLLKNGNVDSGNINTMAKFLSYGYSQLTSSEKTLIDNASYLPTVLGTTTTAYSVSREAKFATKGAALADVEPVEKIVSDQVSEALTPARCLEILANDGGKVVDASVNEINVHDVLKTNKVIGYGKTLYRPTDDGSYKVAYISVDNLYVNIVNNNIYFVVGININGYEVSMVLTSIVSGSNGKMYFTLDGDNTYFGNYRIPASLFNSFQSLLATAMGDTGWFSFDKNNNRFVVDFTEAINDNEQIKFLKANGLAIDISISARGANIDANGYLNISVEASRA